MDKENLTPLFASLFKEVDLSNEQEFDAAIEYLKTDEGGEKIDAILDSLKGGNS